MIRQICFSKLSIVKTLGTSRSRVLWATSTPAGDPNPPADLKIPSAAPKVRIEASEPKYKIEPATSEADPPQSFVPPSRDSIEPPALEKPVEELPKTSPIVPIPTGKFRYTLGFFRIDENLSEDDKKILRITRNTRTGLTFVGLIISGCLVWFVCHYGFSQRDANGVVIPDQYTGSLLAPVFRLADGVREVVNFAFEPSRQTLLPDPLPAPYIQPKYTLVMEMKNVLVAPEWTYTTGYRFKKRPALDYFLDVVGYPNFELVIYTSESPTSAFNVIENIDPKHRILYRLFRDNTKYTEGRHVKDLGRLNRDLSKVIFVDFDSKSAKLNPENVLRIPKWDGEMDDTALVDLAELLKTIHMSDVDDVRPTLQYYSSFDNPPAEFRRRAIALAEQDAARQQTRNQSVLSKYSGFFGMGRHKVS